MRISWKWAHLPADNDKPTVIALREIAAGFDVKNAIKNNANNEERVVVTMKEKVTMKMDMDADIAEIATEIATEIEESVSAHKKEIE